MFFAYGIRNVIIYMLCFIVITFICISVCFNTIGFGFIYIVYVMCFFIVLRVNNVVRNGVR